jgi:hypothetical protein
VAGLATQVRAIVFNAMVRRVRLPLDERLTIDRGLRRPDFLAGELGQVDAIIAEHALGDEDVRRLMTIPAVDVVTATTRSSRPPGRRPGALGRSAPSRSAPPPAVGATSRPSSPRASSPSSPGIS